MSDIIILGSRGSAPLVPDGFPPGYAQLMREFGPGDFCDGLVLLKPSDVSTLGERVPDYYEDEVLRSLVVFSTTSGGGFFCWDAASHVVFVGRGATKKSDVEEVCDEVSAWTDEVIDSKYTPPGLEQGFFIPEGALDAFANWQAEAPGAYSTVHTSLRGVFPSVGCQLLGHLAGAKATRTQFTNSTKDAYVAVQTLPPEIRGRSKYNTRIRVRHAGSCSLDALRDVFAQAGWSVESNLAP